MVTYIPSHDVSAEYSVWRMPEEEVRAFLIATNHGMSEWLDAQWAAAEARADAIFDPEQHDEGLVAELFQEAVGVWPDEYFWQLSSAVIKDACALYEVFLDAMANAVLRRFGASLSSRGTENSWKWPECELFYRHYIGIDVAPPDIKAVLWIRNKLTHLRGDLRTPAGEADFQAHVALLKIDAPATADEAALGLVSEAPYMTRGVRLTQLQTLRILDVVADRVGTVAKAAFPFDYGGKANPHLLAVRAKAPLPIKGFPASLLQL
ncbi:hypothetical protein [Microbacterium sp. SORGH_AS_0421]|uniref:hypothetical protein n=1 Tax=Microbacterium sp. SORGH_AS_0421 TaxID=3041768 RepID=UPI001AE2596E|nr:hypothetical protein [Microbacterium sp. SORGH_AS_0421]MDQ1176331.1 hypothetical protein [Microbacterium sp. SORGH_AS_0421]